MSMRYDLDETNDKELSFKYHTQEFLDVGEEIRKVGHIGRLSKRSPGMILEFYDGLEYLDELYSSYFSKPEDIANSLTRCESKLNDVRYKALMKEYRDNPTDETLEKIQRYEAYILKQLKLIFKQMSRDLVNAELRPKPSAKVQDEFPDEEEKDNKVLRDLYYGLKMTIKNS